MDWYIKWGADPNGVPNGVLHYNALAHAEEWPHDLQFLSPKGALVNSNVHYEVDVALFMSSKNVPLTSEWLATYGRNVYVK